jgi:hypothetical protein
MEKDIGGISKSDLFTVETKAKATACQEHWSQVSAMLQVFADLNRSVATELAHVASNVPPVQGGAPLSPDKAAGDAPVRNPLLEPLPPAPVDVATGVPPMPMAAATAAEVAADGQTDTSMLGPAPPAKRSAQEEAMACAKEWLKVARVSSVEEKGKGKGKNGGAIQDGVAAA